METHSQGLEGAGSVSGNVSVLQNGRRSNYMEASEMYMRFTQYLTHNLQELEEFKEMTRRVDSLIE